MKWAEISIQTTEEAIEPVANILHEVGASGVVIEDPEVLSRDFSETGDYGEVYQLNPDDYPVEGVIIKGYLVVNSFIGETLDRIKESLNNLLRHNINLGLGTVHMTEVMEEDWAHAWKKYYKRVQITEQVTVIPSWEEYTSVDEREIIVELDPGMAFGTGTHPTTILCVKAMEKVVHPGISMIDVGCGSGVLSIVAAKLGVENILALDLDEVAVKVTKENVKVNHVSKQVRVKQNNLLDHLEEQVDCIVANILAEVILRFVPDAARLIPAGGYFITSGIIKKAAPEVQEALLSQGFSIVETLHMEDWVAFTAQKD